MCAGRWGIGPTRVAEPGVRFDDLPKIDLVVVSHNHYDHMDLATLKRLWERDRPQIVTSLGNDALIRSAGIPPWRPGSDVNHPYGVVARDWGKSFLFDSSPPLGIDPTGMRFSISFITIVRNHHWSSRWGTDRNRALWSSFVIQTPSGAIFFAGDTGLGDEQWPAEALAAAGRPIRLALIPIGAFRFAPGQLGTGSHVGPPDALRVWNRLGRPWTLPIHWGTFRLSSEAYDTPPRMLAELMRCTGGPPGVFAAREIGRPWMVPPVAESRRWMRAGSTTARTRRRSAPCGDGRTRRHAAQAFSAEAPPPSSLNPTSARPRIGSGDERDGKALVREDFYFFGARTSGFWVPPSTAPLWLIEPAPCPAGRWGWCRRPGSSSRSGASPGNSRWCPLPSSPCGVMPRSLRFSSCGVGD